MDRIAGEEGARTIRRVADEPAIQPQTDTNERIPQQISEVAAAK